MRKTKDWNWGISPKENGNYDYDQAHLSVMMDIRDELKKLNQLLHCHNFQTFPSTLKTMRRYLGNLKPKKRKKKADGTNQTKSAHS